jgi:hypothetical protein
LAVVADMVEGFVAVNQPAAEVIRDLLWAEIESIDDGGVRDHSPDLDLVNPAA